MSNKNFSKAFFAIAVPVALQYLLRSSLNLLDTVMVGQLGDSAIAGVGIGNQVYFLLNLFMLGISSGMGIFIAQFFGKGDNENILKITGLGLILTLILTSIFTIVVFFGNEWILKMFSEDAEVIATGSTYSKIVSLSYLVTGVTEIYCTACRSTGKAVIPMRASIIGVLLNTVGNYLLIFGVGSVPALGVKGAAIATVIARVIELVIVLSSSYRTHKIIAVRLRHLSTFTKEMIYRFLEQSGIIIIKDGMWGLGMTVYVAIYAHMGTDAVAAVNIVTTIKSVAYVLLMGIANAGVVMVGNMLGSGDKEKAYLYAKRFQKITILVSASVGLIVIGLRVLILSPFNISQQVYSSAYTTLFVLGIFLVLEGFNTVSVIGILRSGADNRFCLVMDTIAVWLIGLPLAYIGGIAIGLSIDTVFALVLSQEIFKAVLLFFRVRSGKWMNNIVNEL